jgi:hypothetical protein
MIGTKITGATNNCDRVSVVVHWRPASRGWTMQASRNGFLWPLFFAYLVIIAVPATALAQDMPPILAPPAQPPAPVAPAPAVSPSAEVAIPPAVPPTPAAPIKPEHTASVDHPAATHHNAKTASIKSKFAALTRRLTAAAHAHRTVTHVAVREPQPQPVFPPGPPLPPPGYFPPGPYQPGPYQQLVYGGPPRPIYGGWARYRYYP